RALSIPVLPWVKPFFPFLEIPDPLLDNLSVWEEIYFQHLAELRARCDGPEVTTRKEVETIYPSGILQAMHQLAERGGIAVALELERWVRRYFCPHESHRPLHRWRLILKLTFLLERHDRIPPPAVLEPLVPKIEQLSNNFNKAQDEIYNVAPPAPPHAMIVKCAEATLISGALYHTFPVQALRKIAQQLNRAERQEVIYWAERQARVMVPRSDPSQLCGERYLRVEPPGFDMPSILDFSE
ncbi:MAG: hypothetical protein SVX43_03530, partial [Cyanobacteriota bacterium]|nr:hypothetical protein [Cyanobacteriota bacterium]